MAISYLGRTDLAHVQPDDLVPDAIGKGVAEGDLSDPDIPQEKRTIETLRQVTSSGFVRRNLQVISGGKPAAVENRAAAAPVQMQATGTEAEPSPAANAILSVSEEMVAEVDHKLDQIREARMKGYEGDACTECGNFTLVRNGTCLKCDSCGSTTGCS